MTDGICLTIVCHLSANCLPNVCQMSDCLSFVCHLSVMCLSFVCHLSDKCHLSVICLSFVCHLSAPHMAGLISSTVGPNLRHEKSRKSFKNGVTESHAYVVFVVSHLFLGPAPRKSQRVTESHGESRVALCLSLFPTQPLAKQMRVSFAIGLEKTNHTQVVGA